MNDWTLGSFLFWLVVVILVPAVIVHFALGRKGGHHIFDKDNLSSNEIRDLPFDMLRKRTIWDLKGSAAAIVGMGVVMVLYPFGCLIGLPINMLGISDEKLFFYAAGVVVLMITLGVALYRKWRT